MNIKFRDARLDDKEFILMANREINKLSGLSDSTFENNIDKDLFEDKLCKVIVIEVDDTLVGFILYSYIYLANCGRGIYLSQAYIKNEYRRCGLLKLLLLELEKRESECNFITCLVGFENEVMANSLNRLGFSLSDLKTYYRKIEKKI